MSASVPVPNDLARLAARVSEWRASHPDRTQPLPAALWQDIAPLRERYPGQRLCRALHVSTHSLRKHGGGPTHPRPAAPCFIPLVPRRKRSLPRLPPLRPRPRSIWRWRGPTVRD